jgi:hypothetical protein
MKDGVGMETRIRRFGGMAVLCVGLSGCAVPPLLGPADISSTPWARDSTASARPAAAGWTHFPLLGKAHTRFQYARKDGRDAMGATAASSASMLRQQVRIEPADLGSVRFSWKVPELIVQADLARRDAADSPVRIILAFEGDRSRLSTRDASVAELVRTLTGEEMPYATLMYVWCNQRSPGTVIKSPRSDRIRKLVVESGSARLDQWLDYERDIRADYVQAFGEPPGALVGVAIMTDTDNTRSTAQAWYGPVRLAPRRTAGR